MPGGDRTGPLGAGPMTGRAAGYCAGYAMPGYANPMGGRGGGLGFGRGGGFGFGRGGGRGWRNQYYATGLTGWQRAAGPATATVPPPPEPPQPAPETRQQELAGLSEQLAQATEALNALRARVEELEAKGR